MFLPLLSLTKHEIRACRADAVAHVNGAYRVGEGLFSLPPGYSKLDDVPTFSTSDECFQFIGDKWPHLAS